MPVQKKKVWNLIECTKYIEIPYIYWYKDNSLVRSILVRIAKSVINGHFGDRCWYKKSLLCGVKFLALRS